MSDDIRIHQDVKFVIAQDQELTVRAMPTDIYKAFLHKPSDKILAVAEFHECDGLDDAIARYDEHIEDGTLTIVDEPIR